MGLDMYLRKRTKEHPDISYEIMYWRKANQIRRWFVENIEDFNFNDNCEKYVISKETLENLINDISAVLENPEMAEELIPTSSGFFFGNQEYDQYYFETLKDTLEEIKIILEETDFENEEIYYTEWW